MPLLYFCFSVEGMLFIKLAVFLKLKFALNVFSVLGRGIVTPVTLCTLQRNQLNGLGFTFRHSVKLP
jgi:hypothetical protein